MTHDVTFSLPQIGLGRADAEFKVKRDGAVLGTLKASKGALVWVPRDAKYGYRIDWESFDSVMKANGTHEKRNNNPAVRGVRSKQGVAS